MTTRKARTAVPCSSIHCTSSFVASSSCVGVCSKEEKRFLNCFPRIAGGWILPEHSKIRRIGTRRSHCEGNFIAMLKLCCCCPDSINTSILGRYHLITACSCGAYQSSREALLVSNHPPPKYIWVEPTQQKVGLDGCICRVSAVPCACSKRSGIQFYFSSRAGKIALREARGRVVYFGST